LVTTKSPVLEDLNALVARVYEAAYHIAKGDNQTTEEALKRIAVSPQCGFSSLAAPVGYQNWAVMTEKLKLVQSIASQIWKDESRSQGGKL
jgi:methionine synthase II (cobalamin-independent)